VCLVANDPTLFDHIIINDNVQTATDEFVRCIEDELTAFKSLP
jgi:guanylate kinase